MRRSVLYLIGGLGSGILLGVFIIFGLEKIKLPFNLSAWLGSKAPAVGDVAPDFELPTLSGDSIQLNELLGHAILLNFWATWCEPCSQEMPLLQDTAQKYPDELRVVMVDDGETEEKIRDFMAQWKYSPIIGLDADQKVNSAYAVHALPTTFFLDGDGRIQAIHVGLLTREWMTDYLQKIGINP